VYEHLVKSNSPNVEVIRSSTYQNPFVPREFIEQMEEQYPDLYRRQEIYGQDIDAEGTIFRPHWFQIVDNYPPGLKWSRYWDLAASTKTTADYTASAAVALDKNSGDVYVRDCIRTKSEWPDVRRLIITTALSEYDTVTGVESALHGLAAFQELQRERELVGTSIRSIRVDKDKVSRALPVASRAEAGKLKLVRGNWISAFVDEAVVFPGGRHDDQVDAVSGAFQMIANSSGGSWAVGPLRP